jgi:hypothetical protein
MELDEKIRTRLSYLRWDFNGCGCIGISHGWAWTSSDECRKRESLTEGAPAHDSVPPHLHEE